MSDNYKFKKRMSDNYNFLASDVYYNNSSDLGTVLVNLTSGLSSFWTEHRKEIDYQFEYNDENNHDDYEFRTNVYIRFKSDEETEMYRELYLKVRDIIEGTPNVGSSTMMVCNEGLDYEFEDKVMFG